MVSAGRRLADDGWRMCVATGAGMERIPERRKRENSVTTIKTTVHDIYGNAHGRKKAGVAGGGGNGGGGGKNSLAARKGRAALATRPPFSTRPSDVSEDKENAAQSSPQMQQQQQQQSQSQQRSSPPAAKGGDVSLSMVGERLKGVKGGGGVKRVSPKNTAVVF